LARVLKIGGMVISTPMVVASDGVGRRRSIETSRGRQPGWEESRLAGSR
jgi:hypothetical protein